MTQLAVAERHPIVTDGKPTDVQDLLDALRQLAPLIDERRAEFETLRRLPDEVFEALADAGLFL